VASRLFIRTIADNPCVGYEDALVPQLGDTEVILQVYPWRSHQIATAIFQILLRYIGFTVRFEEFKGHENGLKHMDDAGGETVVNVEAWAGPNITTLASQYNKYKGSVIVVGFTGYWGEFGDQRQLPLKLASKGLLEKAPTAHHLLDDFVLTDVDIAFLKHQAEDNNPFSSACEWVTNNSATWEQWINIDRTWSFEYWAVVPLTVGFIFLFAACWERLWLATTLFKKTSHVHLGRLTPQDHEVHKELQYAPPTMAAEFSSVVYYAGQDGSVRISLFRCGPCEKELPITISASGIRATCSPSSIAMTLPAGKWIAQVDFQLDLAGQWTPHGLVHLTAETGEGSPALTTIIVTQRNFYPSNSAFRMLMAGAGKSYRRRDEVKFVLAFVRAFGEARAQKAGRTLVAMITKSVHKVAIAALLPKILVDRVVSVKADLDLSKRYIYVFVIGATWLFSFACHRWADVAVLKNRGRTSCREFVRLTLCDKYVGCSEEACPTDLPVFLDLAGRHADNIAKEVWYPVFIILQSLVNLALGLFVIVYLLVQKSPTLGVITTRLVPMIAVGIAILPLTLLWMYPRFWKFQELTYVRAWAMSRWSSMVQNLDERRDIDHALAPPGAIARPNLKESYKAFATAHRAARRYELDSTYSALWLGNMVIVLVLIVGGLDMVNRTHLGTGTISVALFYALLKVGLRAVKDIYFITVQLSSIQRGFVSLLAVCDLLNAETDADARLHALQTSLQRGFSEPILDPPMTKLQLFPCIEFSDVSHSKDANTLDLHNLSFRVPIGSFVSLTKDVHGATSLLKLICGVVLPGNGSVLRPPFAHYAYVHKFPHALPISRDDNLRLHETATRPGGTFSAIEIKALQELFELPTLERISTTSSVFQAGGYRKTERTLELANFAAVKSEITDAYGDVDKYEILYGQKVLVCLLRAVLTDPDVLCVNTCLDAVNPAKRRRLILLLAIWHRFGIPGLLHLATGKAMDVARLPSHGLPRTLIWAVDMRYTDRAFFNLHLHLESRSLIESRSVEAEALDLTECRAELGLPRQASVGSI